MKRDEAIRAARKEFDPENNPAHMIVYRDPIGLGEREGLQHPWGFCPWTAQDIIALHREKQYDVQLDPDQVAFAPNGSPISGTMDRLLATCFVTVTRGKDGKAAIEECGESGVHWDTQEIVEDDEGGMTFVAEDRETCKESEIVWDIPPPNFVQCSVCGEPVEEKCDLCKECAVEGVASESGPLPFRLHLRLEQIDPPTGDIVCFYASSIPNFRPWADSDREQFPQAEKQCKEDERLFVHVDSGRAFKTATEEVSPL